jgi:hypothetical protein
MIMIVFVHVYLLDLPSVYEKKCIFLSLVYVM